jgi:hypothetical protein
VVREPPLRTARHCPKRYVTPENYVYLWRVATFTTIYPYATIPFIVWSARVVLVLHEEYSVKGE